MSNNVVSIIVPVYNVAPYLVRCIDSLISQTHRELEILLIDDGSTDESAALCDKFSEMDERIRVVHQENAGVSASRNRGLSLCTGDYISFVDPDDWLEPQAYEKLVCTIKKANAEAVFCGYYEQPAEDSGAVYVVHQPSRCGTVSGIEALYQCLIGIGYGYFTSVWNKLFTRDALFRLGDFVYFSPEFKIGEDEVWLCKILPYLNRVELIPDPLYNWLQRKSSALHKLSIGSRWHSALLSKEEALRIVSSLPSNSFHLVQLMQGKIYCDLFHLIWYSYVLGEHEEQIYFQSHLKKYFHSFLINKNFSILKKARFILLGLMVNLHFPPKAVIALGSLTRAKIKARLFFNSPGGRHGTY